MPANSLSIFSRMPASPAVTKHSEGRSLRMITIIKCKCGAEYNRTDTKFLITHKGNASCEVCGSILK